MICRGHWKLKVDSTGNRLRLSSTCQFNALTLFCWKRTPLLFFVSHEFQQQADIEEKLKFWSCIWSYLNYHYQTKISCDLPMVCKYATPNKSNSQKFTTGSCFRSTVPKYCNRQIEGARYKHFLISKLCSCDVSSQIPLNTSFHVWIWRAEAAQLSDNDKLRSAVINTESLRVNCMYSSMFISTLQRERVK